jgi:hypothetical protein
MKLIDKKIKMYTDALNACDRRQAKGLMVKDDIRWLENRLKQLKIERMESRKQGNKET